MFTGTRYRDTFVKNSVNPPGVQYMPDIESDFAA
jgi:hypothetical protein